MSNSETVSINSYYIDIFNQVQDIIFITNHLGIIVDVNQVFCQMIGVDKNMVTGLPISSFVLEKDHHELEKITQLQKHNQNIRGILSLDISCKQTCFEYVSTLNATNGLTISVFREVLDKQLQQQQKEHYQHFSHELFTEALDGIVFWDKNGIIINANQAATRIFESRNEQLIGSFIGSYVSERNELKGQIAQKLFRTGAVRDEMFFKMPNGQEKLLEFSSKYHSADGYHMTIFRNISQRHQMEQELRKSEQKFRNIFEGSLEGLILWNDEAIITDINQSACLLFNLNREELVGKSLFKLIPDYNQNLDELEKMMRVLKEKGKHNGTITIHMNEESKFYCEFSSIYHLYADINFTVFKDITEKIAMESRLKKSDTLHVVGELAAGIAHEIRNPMTALKGFIQLLQGDMKDEQSMYFQVILSELDRIDSIVNEFLILAKPQAVKYLKVDIRRIMKETVELLTAQAVMYNVQFQTNFSENLPLIYCEPNQLKKVFVNMIKNAIEVMHKGGKIVIQIESYDTQTIRISIQDQGIGISAEKLKRLGEPFYTTKDRGTGLGLMVSYKIIEEHKGCIQVESQEGVGTTFQIYLPITVESQHNDMKKIGNP
jgi:two-component system, sporulation sensor kinase E